MPALEFKIDLSGNLVDALRKSGSELGKTGDSAKKAKHEFELFEAETGKLGGSLGGLEFNLSALAKGGSLFTFDLAEGLKTALELVHKVVDTFVDLGKELIKTAASTQDLNLALELTTGKEGAKQFTELAESFARTTRFSAAQMKEAWLPLLDVGLKEPKLIDDLTTAATDIAARTHGGVAKVQEVLGSFRQMFLRDQISRGTFTSLGITQENFFKSLGKQLGVTAQEAEKMAKQHKVASDRLLNTALSEIAARQGGAIGGGALAGRGTLGGTLEKLGQLKETLFEGVANSPGMQAVQGFLENFISVMSGDIGKDLVKTLSDAFTSLFGDLSGPDGLQKMKTVLGDIGKTIKEVFSQENIKAFVDMIKGVLENVTEVVKEIGQLSKGTFFESHKLTPEEKAAYERGDTDFLGNPLPATGGEGKFRGRGAGGSWDDVPKFASGGIVSRPTLALVGEDGPEAIVPLDRSASMVGGSRTIHVGGINIVVPAGNDSRDSMLAAAQMVRVELKKILDEAGWAYGATVLE